MNDYLTAAITLAGFITADIMIGFCIRLAQTKHGNYPVGEEHSD